MYSEALAILDRNTALYMIDERQKEIDALREQNRRNASQLAQKDAQISEKDALIAELRRQLEQQK